MACYWSCACKCELNSIFDQRKILTEAIVQLAGQTFALLLLGRNEALREFLAGEQGFRLSLAQGFFIHSAIVNVGQRTGHSNWFSGVIPNGLSAAAKPAVTPVFGE